MHLKLEAQIQSLKLRTKNQTKTKQNSNLNLTAADWPTFKCKLCVIFLSLVCFESLFRKRNKYKGNICNSLQRKAKQVASCQTKLKRNQICDIMNWN